MKKQPIKHIYRYTRTQITKKNDKKSILYILNSLLRFFNKWHHTKTKKLKINKLNVNK